MEQGHEMDEQDQAEARRRYHVIRRLIIDQAPTMALRLAWFKVLAPTWPGDPLVWPPHVVAL